MPDNVVQMKICKKCNTKLPATSEFFAKCSSDKSGFQSTCKVCGKQYRKENSEKIVTRERKWREANPKYNKQWREANPEYYKQYGKDNAEKIAEHKKLYYEANAEKIAVSHKQYREANPEKIATREKQWREANPEYYKQYREAHPEHDKKYREAHAEKIAEYKKLYNEANPEKQAARNKKWREANPEKVAAIGKKWNKANPEQACIKVQRYKAIKKSLISDFTIEQWEACLLYFDHKDAYTGLPLNTPSQDHIVPVSKGGNYTVSNIIPCEPRVNSSKRDKDMVTWFRKQAYYDIERENRILDYVKIINKTKD